MKKTASIVLCVLLGLGLLAPAASAEGAAATGEIAVLSYNVLGLPIFRDGRNPWKDSTLISAYFAEGAYDLIGAQEDFNCHRQLTSRLGDTLPYQTVHGGAVPTGDGLSVFSKYPVYNQNRVAWNKSFGVFSGSSDELTPKGFLHTVVCLTGDPDGPKADFFTIHADAGGSEDSNAAREDNYRQLAAYINEHCEGRALIVTGDFNSRFTLRQGRRPSLSLVIELVPGLRDSWFELDSLGLPAGVPTGVGSIYENGEGVDRVMVRDGGGIAFTFLEAKNLNIQLVEGLPKAGELWLAEGEERHSLSDHSARYARLAWVYDAAHAADYGMLAAPEWSFDILRVQVKSFFKVLSIIAVEPFKLLWQRIQGE